MSLVALGAAKGSPGVTTTALALALAWPVERKVLLVEADASGSGLAPRFALDFDRGVTALAAKARHQFSLEALDPHLQRLRLGARGELAVLVGPRSHEQGRGLGRFWAGFADEVARTRHLDVVVDCGRLTPDSPALAVVHRSRMALLLTRPDIESVAHTKIRLQALQSDSPAAVEIRVVAVGERPYPVAAVEDAVGVPVLGPVSLDANTASVLSGLPGRPMAVDRSLLLRSARTLYDQLEPQLRPSAGSTRSITAEYPSTRTEEISS